MGGKGIRGLRALSNKDGKFHRNQPGEALLPLFWRFHGKGGYQPWEGPPVLVSRMP
jgi:hypothetical protein